MKLALFALFVALAAPATAHAAPAVGYVDFWRVWHESDAGKHALGEVAATLAQHTKDSDAGAQKLYDADNQSLRDRARAQALKLAAKKHLGAVKWMPQDTLVIDGDLTDAVIAAMDAEDKAAARPPVPSAEEMRLRDELAKAKADGDTLRSQLAAKATPPSPPAATAPHPVPLANAGPKGHRP